ncbi:two-component regulator propeller domain-containing protein [Mucilaginibacter sp. SP1R1]|uniref:two-component regulator propeller domain-containing protein n=1 Tax=Mucilaginibacter sp. SP1R1 TaxID=2723091 RepID=UPI00161E8607|nr:two-component regulator propeller domain-containing protein [Mucilaginibacter sp. SP1R1]MBB6147664.1 signal transduction histidine kinase/DNA-binding response OmpR family regulator/ligand-binding sensor domain-containing protein [Mucilaginibacter sp. SP1R1]
MINHKRSPIYGFKGSVIIFLCLLISYQDVNGQQVPLRFSYLTVDEGLSHTDAKDIKQDKQGFIWIGTLFGLDRYDGYTIKRYYNSNDPKNNAFKNRVKSIYPDDDGNLWLTTENGIQCFDTKKEQYIDFNTKPKLNFDEKYSKLIKLKNSRLAVINQKRFSLFDIKNKLLVGVNLQLPQNLSFTDVVSDKAGNIWLSDNTGIGVLDASLHYRHVTVTDVKGVRYDDFSRLYLDIDGNLLLTKATTIFLVNKQELIPLKTSGGASQHISFSRQYSIPAKSFITDLIQDKNHNYWVSTYLGLKYLNSQLQLKQDVTNKSFTRSVNTNYLDKLLIDRSDCLWVCTFGGGVNFCDLNAKMFHTFQHNPDLLNSIPDNHIRAILEEAGKRVWIGTNLSGLSCYDFTTQKFTQYNSYNSTVRLKNSEIISLAFDNEHNLWIGSDNGIEILNPQRSGLWQPLGYRNFPAQNIDALTKDCFGNMWFGSVNNGLGCIYHNKNGVYGVKHHGLGFFIWSDPKRPELLVSTIQGLKRLVIDSAGNILKTTWYQVNQKANSLSSNYTFPIQRQNDSTYWVGTIGGGLNRLVLKKNGTYSVKVYGKKFGVFNDVESLEIANDGNIWMGGNGLECFNPRTEKLVRYDKNDGLQGNSFKVGSSYKGLDGRLYFGGISGLNYFYPDSIQKNEIEPRPIITDLVVNNRKVEIEKSDSLVASLPQVINYDKQIELNYLQNNFVVFFSAMHFANSLKCRYRYKLIGFDKDWKYTDGNNPSAAYSNLDYDKYKFLVEGTNNDGIWSKSAASIFIDVTPPWWKSVFAKFIYCLLFFSGLVGIYIYQARMYRLRREIAVRDMEEKKREEMHLQREEFYQQQLQFFTNISHDFRTPLTLILGPLESLMKENKLSGVSQSYMVMHRNVRRLVNMINELMNFRKVADNAIKLQVKPVVISRFMTDTYDEFYDLATSKDIEFSLVKDDSEFRNWLDLQIVEKILFNLLNNSFKYAPSGGTVELEMFFDLDQFKPAYNTEYILLNDYRADKYVYFRVADSGIGISKESIGHIFDRYYRISNDHLGSGVGLALVKSLTQLHKGDIYVYSERHKGTEIIIALPWGENSYLPCEKSQADDEPLVTQLERIDNSVLLPALIAGNNHYQHIDSSVDKQQILLVEDNDELRLFLKEALQQHYHVYEATNGREALEIAVNKIPDLIISDVMMPVMDGIELCRLIKDKFETSHIPFMILSAKDALDARIKGLESGADHYFSKPVSIDLLLLTLHNIFEQRQKLKAKYTKDYYSEATELVQSTKDKEFIDKLLGLIEENIQAPELDVDYLCQHLYTSRTKLYQKIKSISDQSVGEFIRTVRLKKAIHIMTHEDISINEVIERIGLQSSSYFSRAFKKEFGKSPSQFLQTVKRDKSYHYKTDV